MRGRRWRPRCGTRSSRSGRGQGRRRLPADGADTTTLLLASAARAIVVGPETMVSPLGFAVEGRYVRRALEQVGVEPEVFAKGMYKNAGEVLVRDTMSAAQREQVGALLDGRLGDLTAALAQGRRVDRETAARWIDEAPFGAEQAVARGIVDAVAYEDELEHMLVAGSLPSATAAPRRAEIGAKTRTARWAEEAEELALLRGIRRTASCRRTATWRAARSLADAGVASARPRRHRGARRDRQPRPLPGRSAKVKSSVQERGEGDQRRRQAVIVETPLIRSKRRHEVIARAVLGFMAFAMVGLVPAHSRLPGGARLAAPELGFPDGRIRPAAGARAACGRRCSAPSTFPSRPRFASPPLSACSLPCT